jgi:hypothetical protein
VEAMALLQRAEFEGDVPGATYQVPSAKGRELGTQSEWQGTGNGIGAPAFLNDRVQPTIAGRRSEKQMTWTMRFHRGNALIEHCRCNRACFDSRQPARPNPAYSGSPDFGASPCRPKEVTARQRWAGVIFAKRSPATRTLSPARASTRGLLAKHGRRWRHRPGPRGWQPRHH